MKYIVEHMEEELYEWSVLEYAHMLKYVGDGNLILCNLPAGTKIPESLSGAICTEKSIYEMENVDITRVALLDPCADQELCPADVNEIDYVLCGGILGTDEFEGPMVDRTEGVRDSRMQLRHLGPLQLTADGAVLVSRLILELQQPLDAIPFIDRPNIPLGKKESIDMPFRYIKTASGKPLLPPGMKDLWRRQDF